MKRSLMLILVLLCGIYLVLTITKGDVTNAENSEINPLSDFEDYPVYFGGSDVVDVTI